MVAQEIGAPEAQKEAIMEATPPHALEAVVHEARGDGFEVAADDEAPTDGLEPLAKRPRRAPLLLAPPPRTPH